MCIMLPSCVPATGFDESGAVLRRQKLTAQSFYIEPCGKRCRVIKVIPGQLLTEEWITDIDFDKGNGIDVSRDILKLAVAERHLNKHQAYQIRLYNGNRTSERRDSLIGIPRLP